MEAGADQIGWRLGRTTHRRRSSWAFEASGWRGHRMESASDGSTTRGRSSEQRIKRAWLEGPTWRKEPSVEPGPARGRTNRRLVRLTVETQPSGRAVRGPIGPSPIDPMESRRRAVNPIGNNRPSSQPSWPVGSTANHRPSVAHPTRGRTESPRPGLNAAIRPRRSDGPRPSPSGTLLG